MVARARRRERAATTRASRRFRSGAAVGGARGETLRSVIGDGVSEPSRARTHVSSFASTPVDEPGGSPPLRRGDGALREVGGARRRGERHRAHAAMVMTRRATRENSRFSAVRPIKTSFNEADLVSDFVASSRASPVRASGMNDARSSALARLKASRSRGRGGDELGYARPRLRETRRRSSRMPSTTFSVTRCVSSRSLRADHAHDLRLAQRRGPQIERVARTVGPDRGRGRPARAFASGSSKGVGLLGHR